MVVSTGTFLLIFKSYPISWTIFI